jgi:hypothetical protein
MVVAVAVDKAGDEGRRNRNSGEMRDMVEVDPQARIAHAFNEPQRSRPKTPVFRDILVVEGRQHEHAARARLDRGARKLDRIGNGRRPGARQQQLRIKAVFDEGAEQRSAFPEAEGIGFAGGAEDGEAVGAFLQQRPANAKESRQIRLIVALEWRQHRYQHAKKSIALHVHSGFLLRCHRRVPRNRAAVIASVAAHRRISENPLRRSPWRGTRPPIGGGEESRENRAAAFL